MIKTWTGKAGSVLFFSEDLIHAVGVNKTNDRRMILAQSLRHQDFRLGLSNMNQQKKKLKIGQKNLNLLLLVKKDMVNMVSRQL